MTPSDGSRPVNQITFTATFAKGGSPDPDGRPPRKALSDKGDRTAFLERTRVLTARPLGRLQVY